MVDLVIRWAKMSCKPVALTLLFHPLRRGLLVRVVGRAPGKRFSPVFLMSVSGKIEDMRRSNGSGYSPRRQWPCCGWYE